MQQRILELIPRILNEQLTEELLIVNDNLNNIFLRHERYFWYQLSLSLVLSLLFYKQSSLLFSIETISLILIGLNGSDLASLQRYFSTYLICLNYNPPLLQELRRTYIAFTNLYPPKQPRQVAWVERVCGLKLPVIFLSCGWTWSWGFLVLM